MILTNFSQAIAIGSSKFYNDIELLGNLFGYDDIGENNDSDFDEMSENVTFNYDASVKVIAAPQ